MKNKKEEKSIGIIAVNTSNKYSGIGKYSGDLSQVVSLISLVLDKRLRGVEYPGKKVILPAFIGNGYEINIRILNHYVKSLVKGNVVHFTAPVKALKDPENIVTFHDLYELNNKDEKKRKKGYKQYTQFIGYHVISTSELLKQQLIDFGFDRNRITVIPLAVDNTVFRHIDHQERDFILTVGDGLHKNNYDICRILNNAGIKHIHLGREVDLNHFGNHHYFFRIQNTQLNELYNRAIATIRYSVDEGFGVPVLESLFAGTPIILNRLPIFEEILGKQYPLFIDSIDEIPETVKKVQNERETVLNYFDKIKIKYEIENWRNTMKSYYKKLGIFVEDQIGH